MPKQNDNRTKYFSDFKRYIKINVYFKEPWCRRKTVLGNDKNS